MARLFQSTHPRGVRPPDHPDRAGSVWRFNPRTRVGCDRYYLCGEYGERFGFNPRTRVGCDLFGGIFLHRFGSFNPRTRVGCDLTIMPYCLMFTLFQSTHPRGVRRWPESKSSRPTSFQSTHPRGVRHQGAIRAKARHGRFQSTHPRGVRPLFSTYSLLARLVSIHAPAWGATLSTEPSSGLPDWFQSTHPRGVRLIGHYKSVIYICVSIHAPAWGATPRP